MYDSFLDTGTYHSLRSQVSSWVNGDSSVELDELVEDIEEAYKEGEISSSGYDNLMAILEDYL